MFYVLFYFFNNFVAFFFFFFFFNDTATTEIYTLSLHDALPISRRLIPRRGVTVVRPPGVLGARRKLSPVVWALIVRTRLSSGCLGFCAREQVVGATGDLARDGE